MIEKWVEIQNARQNVKALKNVEYLKFEILWNFKTIKLNIKEKHIHGRP